jgi:hypothetical protein
VTGHRQILCLPRLQAHVQNHKHAQVAGHPDDLSNLLHVPQLDELLVLL